MKFINPFQRDLGKGTAIIVDAADFDGTNDYMLRGAALTGVADSKSGILSIWLRVDALPAVIAGIIANSTGGNGFGVSLAANGRIVIEGRNAANAVILNIGINGALTAVATWVHVLASWDLATLATHFYVNDVSSNLASTVINDTIDYTKTNFSVGAYTDGSFKSNLCFADIYFYPGKYLDFSQESNRRWFITSSGKPANLSLDGSLPIGSAPAIYLHLDDGEAVANFATNRGTGGNFTITGTLDTASTSPSD